MARRMTWVAVLAGWLMLPGGPASARLLPNWPYDKLMKEADLVVVAVAKSAEDTKDQPADPLMKEAGYYIGRTSTLTVKGTLKGKAGEEIKVLHYRLNEKKVSAIIDGPTLIEFRSGPTTIKAKGYLKYWYAEVEYLLFLKARKDGRYEPVSGEYDPSLSVREVLPAMESSAKK
jgi:hypothetical protein